MKSRICLQDGTDLPASYEAYPETNFLFTAFNRLDVSLNDVYVSGNSTHFAMANFIETLLNFDKDTKDTMLAAQGYFSPADEDDHKDKFAKSKKKIFDHYGRLAVPIFNQGRLIPSGVDIKLRFTRSPADFCVKTSAAAAAPTQKIIHKIEQISLFVRKVKLSSNELLNVEKKFLSNTAKFPIKDVQTKLFNIPSGLNAVKFNHVSMGKMPEVLVVGLVAQDQFEGVSKKSAYTFSHFNIKQIGLTINDQSKDNTHIVDYSSDLPLCTKAYYDLFKNLNHMPEGHDISIEDFIENRNLYSFNLTVDEVTGCSDHMNLVQQGDIGLSVTFAKPLTKAVTLIIYMQSSSILEIDRTRNILIS
jgi:hypothetical protein